MIKSESFGGVVFSGQDAKKFANQVRYGRAPTAASVALRHGDELLKSFRQRTSGQQATPASDDKKRGGNRTEL